MAGDMLAVTIGVGDEHQRLAHMAAERMHRGTGLDVRVLGTRDLQTSGCRNPFHLKFRLFDLLDAENILFFDADVHCLRCWDPRPYADLPELVAVRGYWFDPWVERVGPVYGFGADEFNSGFFICNRRHHAPWLRLAEKLQNIEDEFHGLRNPDEIALNAARAALHLPIRFLDRRFNWLRYGQGSLSEKTDVVLAHACDAELRRRYGEADGLPFESTAALPGPERSDFAGATYIYDRYGYDSRPLEFRSDGTIGEGGGNAERYWFEWEQDGVRRLCIGSCFEETCSLIRDREGICRGQWNHFEQMPVSLVRHRAQVIIDLLSRKLRMNAPIVGVEIGVHRGEASRILLKAIPQLHLYMVDPWRAPRAGSDYWATNDACARLSQADRDEAMCAAAKATDCAAERRTLVPCESADAATFLPNELDFVFIDGDHSESGVRSDLEAWLPKLKPNGLFIGHDYANPNFPGVQRAVDDYAGAIGAVVRTASDHVWFYPPTPENAAQRSISPRQLSTPGP